MFRETLGIGSSDAPWLRTALLDSAAHCEGTELASDQYGARWRVDMPISRGDRTVALRTLWIVADQNSPPRFLSCWVL